MPDKPAGNMLPPKSRRGGAICYGVPLAGAVWRHSGERLLARLSLFCALALLGVAASGLAGCGRAGPLEPPPGPAFGAAPTASAVPAVAPASPVGGPVAGGPTPPEVAQKNGFDAYGNPVAPPGEKKSFLLDFLLQ
jgi:predicted small lipoprotein YifL